MRIIAGKFKGRILSQPDRALRLRPTTDSNRESLFNILLNSRQLKEAGFRLDGTKVIDICAGTGAVGFEALSRGAMFVTFVESNFEHLEVIKKNAEILGLVNGKDYKILSVDATVSAIPSDEAGLIFIDPPYHLKIIPTIIKNLMSKHSIGKNTLIITESDKRDNLNIDLKLLEQRSYGKAVFSFFMKTNTNSQL